MSVRHDDEALDECRGVHSSNNFSRLATFSIILVGSHSPDEKEAAL